MHDVIVVLENGTTSLRNASGDAPPHYSYAVLGANTYRYAHITVEGGFNSKLEQSILIVAQTALAPDHTHTHHVQR